MDVVQRLTDTSFSATDVILTINGGNEVELVDGPSAGAALTVALIAAVKGQK